jgi:hypothetical protein|tara:strand:- start:662 stop:796 length:135 start_codon:yes stop_codon:yes gene_type:complete
LLDNADKVANAINPADRDRVLNNNIKVLLRMFMKAKLEGIVKDF